MKKDFLYNSYFKKPEQENRVYESHAEVFAPYISSIFALTAVVKHTFSELKTLGKVVGADALNAIQLVDKWLGGTKKNLRNCFRKSFTNYRKNKPV